MSNRACQALRLVLFVMAGGAALFIWSCGKGGESQQSSAPTSSSAQASGSPALPQTSGTLASGKIPLKLLFAGHPGSEREKDFVSFLEHYFEKVTTTDQRKFAGSVEDNVDVVLIDYDGDAFSRPNIGLNSSYNRATVTIAETGALVCGSLRLKTGYT